MSKYDSLRDGRIFESAKPVRVTGELIADFCAAIGETNRFASNVLEAAHTLSAQTNTIDRAVDDFLKETHFLRRGDPAQKEAVADQGFLQVLMPGADAGKRWQTAPPTGWRTSYRRRALAGAAASRNARMAGRVTRPWQQP